MLPQACCCWSLAYDLDFDQVALSPKLAHHEKVRLLVLLRHVWTDGMRFVPEPITREQLEREMSELGPEISRRIAP